MSEADAAFRLPRRTSLRLNAAASAAGNLVFFAGVFLLTPLAIRHLGSEAWGIWQIVGATTAYAALLNLGLGTTIHQEVAYNLARSDWDRLARAFSNVRVYLLGAAALILMCLALAGEPFLRTLVTPEQLGPARDALFASAGIIAVTLPIRIYLPALAGLQRSEFFGAFQIVATVLMVGGVWLGFRQGMGLVGFVVVMTVAPILSSLASFVIVRRLLPRDCLRWRRPDGALFAQMVRHSLSTLVFSMGTVILYQTMKLVAAWRCGGAEAAGHMGLAVSIVQSLGVLFFPGLHALLSRVTQLHGEGRPEAIRELLERSLIATGLLVIPSVAFLIQDADLLFRAWLGSTVPPEAIAPLGDTTRLLLVGQGAYVLTLPCYYALLGTGRHVLFGVAMLAIVVANAVFGWMAAGLFPRIETLGFVSGVLSLGLSVLVTFPVALRRFPVPLARLLGRCLGAPLLALLPGVAGVAWRPRLGPPIMDLVLDAALFALLTAPGLELARRRLLRGAALS